MTKSSKTDIFLIAKILLNVANLKRNIIIEPLNL